MPGKLHRGLFVTGTDTGVGKTSVACLLLRGLRERSIEIGVMKPVETGVGEGGPEDARALCEAAGCADSLEVVCPQQFALPAAPNVAAQAEGRSVDRAAIEDAWNVLRARHRRILVEGAGGLRVPLDDNFDMGDLAASLKLPVLLVARGALGTINHTRLTLDRIGERRIPLLGVVINCADGPLSASDEANLGFLRDELGSLLLGEIPYSPGPGAIEPILERLL